MAAAISTAVGSERRSATTGYALKKGFFDNETPNLPQQIVILAEANTANQAGISTTKRVITSAAEAGNLYGYGSPIHQIMRILRPISGDGVGGIPTIVMAQIEAVGATATTHVWTITGNATANATHYIRINGRTALEGKAYAVNIVTGDTPTAIAQKYANAINAVLGAPGIATVAAGVLTITTKWKGLSSAELKTAVDINGVPAGLTYALVATAGAGAADIAPALLQFEDNWYTTVINSYGTAAFTALEGFNGIPDDQAPTGRYEGRTFKPFMAFFGTTLSVINDITTITDAAARINQVTNVHAPAPASEGFPWEAASNMVRLFTRTMQDNPSSDVLYQYYPDMPVPPSGSIGPMADYNNRDLLIKAGSSTVTLKNGQYQVIDLVTTYHPVGENPLQYNYARNLNLDWNIAYGYRLMEDRVLIGKVIIPDDQITDVDNAIKPKDWKANIYDYLDTKAADALINDTQFSKDGLQVEIDEDNPNRFNTSFPYRRTGTVRISSTTAQAGF